jgi:hypothetical protein
MAAIVHSNASRRLTGRKRAPDTTGDSCGGILR